MGRGQRVLFRRHEDTGVEGWNGFSGSPTTRSSTRSERPWWPCWKTQGTRRTSQRTSWAMRSHALPA